MDFTIRPAVEADRAFLAEWTSDTFVWGDYVAERFVDWLGEPRTKVFVADVDGLPIALGRVTMVSDTEAWANAMRVHPEYRRLGIGSAVGEPLWTSAQSMGAKVVRLAIEEWNTASRGQVAKAGFRPIGDWHAARRGVGDSSPVPEGNGGVRVKGAEALKPAHSAEAEPALLSWSTGELARAAHGLFATGWTWRRLTSDHLADAAVERILWEGRPGWAMAELDEPLFAVHWLETNPEDVRAMVRALVERAADSGADSMRAMIPDVGWLVQAFRRAGFETNALTVFGLAL